MPKRSRDYVEGLVEDLRSPGAAKHYLNAALEDSVEMFLVALKDVAEAHRIAVVAEKAGLQRESLYRILSEEGNPRFSSLTSILAAMNLRIVVEAREQPLTVASAAAVQAPAAEVVLEHAAAASVASASHAKLTRYSGPQSQRYSSLLIAYAS